MTDVPDTGLRKKLLELAASMMASREKTFRAVVKKTVGDLLTNQRPN